MGIISDREDMRMPNISILSNSKLSFKKIYEENITSIQESIETNIIKNNFLRKFKLKLILYFLKYKKIKIQQVKIKVDI